MGDFFDNVVIFLEEYYVYVIGVGLIIILMLIGFLASRRKARKSNSQNATMANINDVNTGSISDVASTLQTNNVSSVADVKLPDANPTVAAPAQPIVADNEETEVLETEPTTSPVSPVNNDIFSSVGPTTSPISDVNAVSQPAEEPAADKEEDFNKTEVIDFSSLSKPEPMVDFRPISPIADTNTANANGPLTVGTINQVADTTVAAPATDINDDEPTLVQTVSSMPANEVVTEAKVTPAAEEVVTEPITDIKPTDYNPFVADKSQYDDILNGESSVVENPAENPKM